MKKITGMIIFFLLFVPLARSIDKAPAATSGVVAVGNKFCPVSGDKISGKHFVVYEGKRYELCCPMCEKDFKKDPAKYIAKMTKQEIMSSENEGRDNDMIMEDVTQGHQAHHH